MSLAKNSRFSEHSVMKFTFYRQFGLFYLIGLDDESLIHEDAIHEDTITGLKRKVSIFYLNA